MTIFSPRSWTIIKRVWFLVVALSLIDFGSAVAMGAYVFRTDEWMKMLILSPMSLFAGAMLLWVDYIGPRPGDPT